MIMAMAVATCSPTMNARYAELDADTFRSLAHCPPTTAGMRMAWPRLDTGKSSVIPWISPTTPASPYVRCDMPALRSHGQNIYAERAWCGLHEHVHPTPGGPPATSHRSRAVTPLSPVSS